MRTALLISGLPRAIDGAFPSIRDAIIAPNNPDVFIHTWGDENDQGLRNKITDMFKPVVLAIERPKIILNSHMNLDRMMRSHGRGYTRPNFVEMIYSMLYSLLQSNTLKEAYRLQHDIHYDCVIRARFDLKYKYVVDVKNYDNSIIHIGDRPDLPEEMIDDRFAFGPNHLMNLYCGSFTWIEHIFLRRDNIDGVVCGETILYEMFKTLGIKHHKISGLTIYK